MEVAEIYEDKMKIKMSHIAIICSTILVGACQESASRSSALQDNTVNPNAAVTFSHQKQDVEGLNAQPQSLSAQAQFVSRQWPMFSGPDGSGKVTGDFVSPTTWSVRKNDNILWKTELPAGGQSGISVWGDNVFFTINKPLDTPKFEVIKHDFEKAKLSYELHYEYVANSVKNEEKYRKLVDKVAKSSGEWTAFLAQYKQKKSIKMSGVQLQRAIKKVTRESPLAKAITKAEKARDSYIHQQTPELLKSYKHYVAAEKQLKNKGVGKDIVLYCISASDGRVKWQRTIKGVTETMYNYAFSDATSPTPITDGKRVWVVNATGGMASFTLSGELLWARTWQPSTGRPFNKQYDTLSSGDLLFNVQPPLKNDSSRNPLWNYLHAINKYTGETQWVSTEALTHYNTPMLGKTKSGESAILIGRGGPHGVPEKNEGLSLLNMQGEALWNWQASSDDLEPWGATDIQIWNKDRAIWFAGKTKQTLFSIDTQTGITQQKYDLTQLSRYVFNEESKKYELHEIQGATFERQPYTPVLVGDALYYLVRYEPFIGYLNLATGKHIQVEIPTEVNRDEGENAFIWKKLQKTDQLNSRGQRHNTESRSQGDGTQKAFLASPIVVNNNLYFTNAHGLTYVIDTTKPFNEKALVAVNDLGKKGQTYSLSSMAHANGVLFQRSLKAIYAFK